MIQELEIRHAGSVIRASLAARPQTFFEPVFAASCRAFFRPARTL